MTFSSKTCLLPTIRSDNYERLQLAKELEGVRQQTLSLPPLPKGSYAEVIKGPARRLDGTARALKIEDGLVDALLADVEAGDAKDALPPLAFTLERLYEEDKVGGSSRRRMCRSCIFATSQLEREQPRRFGPRASDRFSIC